jgi:DNA-binding winged helix-turn-helix (wHTH) protein
MRRPGQVLDRFQLLEHARDYDYENRSNIVDVYVRNVREKVDRPFGVESIETVRGAGYRLRADGGQRARQATSGTGDRRSGRARTSRRIGPASLARSCGFACAWKKAPPCRTPQRRGLRRVDARDPAGASDSAPK